MAYAGVRGYLMFTRGDSNIQQLTNTLDLFAKTDSFNLAEQNIEIVVGLQDFITMDFIPIPSEMGSTNFV
jgi:hypothetical protein